MFYNIKKLHKKQNVERWEHHCVSYIYAALVAIFVMICRTKGKKARVWVNEEGLLKPKLNRSEQGLENQWSHEGSNTGGLVQISRLMRGNKLQVRLNRVLLGRRPEGEVDMTGRYWCSKAAWS